MHIEVSCKEKGPQRFTLNHQMRLSLGRRIEEENFPVFISDLLLLRGSGVQWLKLGLLRFESKLCCLSVV